MSRSPNRFWALVALLLSGQAFALGLGEIRLDSALNEPIRAQIELLSATPEELDNLTVQLASADLFDRYGLDRPGFLQSMNFRVMRSGGTDGNFIAVTSTQPITEPFLTFLVEASWQRGRLLREYTVLLDPPTFAPPPAAPVTQNVQPPVRNQAADSGQIQRPAPAPAAPTPAPAPVAVPPSAVDRPSEPVADTTTNEPSPEAPAEFEAPVEDSFDTAPGGDVQVQRGDTLWSIASRYRPDNRLTINQTMLAIFEANPEAFAGNINSMAAGANLRIPSADEVFRITRADALAEVQRQNSAWDGGLTTAGSDSGPSFSPQPSLELVPPDEDSLSGDSSDVNTVPDAVEPEIELDPDSLRITEIEALISDQQDGLVEISDTELAALQRELATLRGEELPPEPVVVDPEPEVPVEDTLPDEDDVFVTEEPDTSDDADAVANNVDGTLAGGTETVDPASEPEVTPPPAPPAPQESIVDKILGYVLGLWGFVGLGLLLVVAGLLFFMRRSSGDSAAVEAAPTGAEATAMWNALDDGDFAEQTIAEDPPAEQTTQMAAMTRAGETTIVVEEAGSPSQDEGGDFSPTMELPAAPEAEAPEQPPAEVFSEETAANPTLEDTFSSETALNLDQSDPIAEADFHMAYGLYDQAADLIIGALDVEPERTDYLAKLCEIYFVWGNRDAFVDAADRFKGVLGDGQDPEWDKTVIMGQQIAGDHALFSEAQGATKAVDLAFDDEAGDAALDMDLAAGADGEDDFIDLGEDDPVRVAGAETNTAVDFDFEADGGGDTAETGATEVMPAADAADLLAGDFGDDDMKTAEMPTIEESTAEMPTIEEATAEMPTVDAPLDDTAEASADDDFMDLDATGAMPQIGADDATALASVDDLPSPDATSEIDLDDLGLDLDALGDDLESSVSSDLDALDDGTQDMPMDDDILAATGRNEALNLPDDDDSSTNLLDATGQTQVLPGDFAVETGTGTNIEKALSEEDSPLAGDAETMMASLDDEDEDFEFAKTESLSDDMELDLDDLTAALEVSSADDATVDQPLDSGHANELDDSPTAAFPPDGLSDELSDARTMTEVGTKLDLARAYVDMGDPGGAKSILEEVLDEGDDAQKQQAQQLLDSLPE